MSAAPWSEARLERAQDLAEELGGWTDEARRRRLAELATEDQVLAELVAHLIEGARPTAQQHLAATIDRFDEVLDDSAAARGLRGSFGGYRILEAIGSGSGGAVYRAKREKVGGDVALKVLLHPEEREPFLREQRIHASLIHPGIPRYHHGAPDAPLPYFALEFVSGRPITEHCREVRANLQERLRLMQEVCQAVAYAQGHYLHRDLKPDNVLVTRERRGPSSARVLDFGAAVPLAGRAQAPLAGHDEDALPPAGFSYGYAAPEQYTMQPLSPATDVFALGVLLYELLATQRPFGDTDDPEQIVQRTLETDPPPVSVAAARAGARAVLGRVSASAWRDLDRLVATAMSRDPARRYPNAGALLADLINFEQSRPLSARKPRLSYRTGKFVRRHPWLVLTSLLFLTGTTVSAVHLQRAYQEARLQAESATRAGRFMTLALTGGQWSAAPRRDLTLGEVLDRLMAASEQLSIDPPLKAELLARAGNLYGAIGQYARAEELLSEALALRKLRPDAFELPWDYLGLAEVQRERGKLNDALVSTRRAQYLAAQRILQDPELRAVSTLALARVLNLLGRHNLAAPMLLQTARVLANYIPAELLDALHYELGNAYQAGGRLEEARRLHADSLQLAEAQGDLPSIAESLLSLANLDEQMGNPADAEARARRAVTLYEDYYGAESPATLSARVLQARMLNSLGRPEAAAEVSHRALDVARRVYREPHETTALALHALCHAEIAMLHAEQALTCAEEVREVERALHREAPGHAHVVQALERLAEAWELKPDGARAEHSLREAVQEAHRIVPSSPLDLARTKGNLGHLLLELSRCSEAVLELDESARILKAAEPEPQRFLKRVREDLAACQSALLPGELTAPRDVGTK